MFDIIGQIWLDPKLLPIFANYVLMFDNIGQIWLAGTWLQIALAVGNAKFISDSVHHLVAYALGASLLARSLSWSKLFMNVVDWLAEVDQGSLS